MVSRKSGPAAALALALAAAGASGAVAQSIAPADVSAAVAVEQIISVKINAVTVTPGESQADIAAAFSAAVNAGIQQAMMQGYTATQIYAAIVALTPINPTPGSTRAYAAVALASAATSVQGSLVTAGGSGAVSGAMALSNALNTGSQGGGGSNYVS